MPDGYQSTPKYVATRDTSNVGIPYGAYISRVFNFANLESFAKFIQQKFEPLRCNTHGQHEFAKFIQRIPSKQLFAKI